MSDQEIEDLGDRLVSMTVDEVERLKRYIEYFYHEYGHVTVESHA